MDFTIDLDDVEWNLKIDFSNYFSKIWQNPNPLFKHTTTPLFSWSLQRSVTATMLVSYRDIQHWRNVYWYYPILCRCNYLCLIFSIALLMIILHNSNDFSLLFASFLFCSIFDTLLIKENKDTKKYKTNKNKNRRAISKEIHKKGGINISILERQN